MTSNNITGTVGLVGPSGAPTSNAPRGITGATGPPGIAGAPGPTGAPTSNAPRGMWGVTGAVGPVGLSTNYNSSMASAYSNGISCTHITGGGTNSVVIGSGGTNSVIIGSNSNSIIGSNYNIVGGGNNITTGFQYSSIGSRPIVNRFIEIRGNGNVPDNKSRRMIIHSSTDRDTCFSPEHITKVPIKNIEQLDDSPVSGESFTEEEMSSAMFLSTDNGVWIETSEQGKYMNLVEMMEDYQQLKETVSELQDMVKDIYYAPPYGPGYLKAQALFESKVEEQNQ